MVIEVLQELEDVVRRRSCRREFGERLFPSCYFLTHESQLGSAAGGGMLDGVRIPFVSSHSRRKGSDLLGHDGVDEKLTRRKVVKGLPSRLRALKILVGLLLATVSCSLTSAQG